MQDLAVYETIYILRPDATETTQKSFLEKIKGIIQAHAGSHIATEDWGKRRLSYPIKKESKGSYIYIIYSGNNSLVAEIERNLRINEQVLRFLTVKVESEYDVKKFKRKPTVNVVSSVHPE